MANCCHRFFGSGSLDLYYGSYLEGKEAVFCMFAPKWMMSPLTEVQKSQQVSILFETCKERLTAVLALSYWEEAERLSLLCFPGWAPRLVSQ